MSKQFILAYCVENSNIAKEIEQNLSPAGYTFEHASCPAGGDFIGEILATKTEKIILLVSDNFLRSVACMKDGLSWFQSLTAANRLLTVVVDGRVMNNGSWETVPTSFEKVSNVIKYMNFWQEEYLELRKNKREGGADETQYNDHLTDVRTISSEVGEFLRHVRSSKHYSFEEFSCNNYEELFRWNGDMAAHEKFSATSSLPIQEEETTVPEMPATPIVETPVAPTIAAVTPPIIDVAQGIANPVELAKPEPIEVPTVKEEADNIVEELFEEETEAVVETSEPIVEIPEVETPAVEIENLPAVEEETENSLDILVDEIVAEEKAQQADEGVSLEDFDKEMFGEDENNEEEEAVSISDIKKENLFAVNPQEDETTNKLISDEDKRKTIEELLKKSKAALAEGKVPDVLNMLKKGTEQYPEEVNLRYYYAYVLANSADNTDAAKEQLNSVLKQSPAHADANYLAGEIAELEESFVIAKNEKL